MTIYKFHLFILFVFFATGLKGQDLKRANDLFKNGAYAKAIPLYEAFIAQKTNNSAAKSKLANCYRILSRPDKAAPLLKEVVEDKTARPDDFLHYGETLMMLGKYEEAKDFFKKYNTLEPDKERGRLLLENVDKLKNLHPLFPNILILPFSKNSEGDDNAPIVFQNGIAFASDRHSGFSILKEKNPATGRDYTTIYYAERLNDSSFSEPRQLSAKLTEINRNTSNISFTKDGKQAYFCRNSNIQTRSGAFNMQIYSAETEDGTSFHNIEILPFCTPENNYMYPSVSPDGKHLFFVAERGDGFGGLDIYMVTQKAKGGWSKAENLGAAVNTPSNEGFPFAAPDGKLYFCSKGHPTYGGYDIFVTQQDSITREWQKPINIGSPINSPFDDISICFSQDLQTGAFTSMRGGRGDDIFIFKVLTDSLKSDSTTKSVPPPTIIRIDTIAASKVTIDSFAKTKLEKEQTSIAVIVSDTSHLSKIKEATKPEAEQIAEQTPKTHISSFKRKNKNKKTTVQLEEKINAPQKIAINTNSDTSKTTKTYLDQMQNLLDNDKLRLNKSFIAENLRLVSQTDSSISSVMAIELDKLADFLKKNKKLVVEICVHTEGGIETDKLAKNISTKQAEMLVEYLKTQGIREKRLIPHGYGRIHPLKDCTTGGCTPAEDLMNRRVEVKIKGI